MWHPLHIKLLSWENTKRHRWAIAEILFLSRSLVSPRTRVLVTCSETERADHALGPWEPSRLDLILQLVLGATTSLGFSYYSVPMPCYAMIYFLLPGRRAFTILLLRGAVYFLYCLGAGRFRHVAMPSHTFGPLCFLSRRCKPWVRLRRRPTPLRVA